MSPSAALMLEKEIYPIIRNTKTLDGKGAIPHLDSVLTLDKLNGIQWMAGAGQPDGGSDVVSRVSESARQQ